jgi:hypothetical protein
MILNLHPKCANPNCAAAFEWLAGGKLFRFRHDSGELAPVGGNDASANGSHGVGHFWLCERCSNVYTLQHEQDRGVVILPLWPELPAAENKMLLPSS